MLGHHKDVLARLRVDSVPICARCSLTMSVFLRATGTTMRSFLLTIPPLTDSSSLMLQEVEFQWDVPFFVCPAFGDVGTFRPYSVGVESSEAIDNTKHLFLNLTIAYFSFS